MSKIKIRALNKNSLTSESYQNHLHHFLSPPLSLKIDKTSQFSKQSSEVHDLLKRIKDTNEYSDDFFLAAQKFINELYNESKQPHKQILTKDYWNSSTETLIDDHLNSNHSSTSKPCPELSVSRCLNYSEILETHQTTDSLLESNHLQQNLNDQNLVIPNEDQNLTLSENFQASTSDHDLTNALSKVPPENIPTQLQQQSININVNTEDNEDNQNWKKLLKKNWHFLAIITALTVFSILLVMNKDRIWQNNINTINSNWKYLFDKVHETLAQTFINTFSEQVRKSNIYQTTEKAYEELKIEHEVILKNLKDLEINYKKTNKQLETSKKENTKLDKKLTLKNQEFETANKENANLDKKLTLKEQELETTNKENANIDKKLSIKEQELEAAKKENADLDKKLTLKEQDLEIAKKVNMNLDKKLSIKEKELEAAKKENVNLNNKLTAKEQGYEKSQTKIKDLTKKIESLEKEVKILDKQRIKGEERKQVILKLKQAYKELSESCAKIEQEKIEKKTKEIIEKADKSLNDNEEC